MTIATDKISQLREVYSNSRTTFDFAAMPYISGDHNKGLRIQIIEQLTGKKPTSKQSTEFATIEAMKNSFDQLSIF